MLTLTPTAIEAVDALLAPDGVPAEAGLRIAATGEELSIAVAEGPVPGDQVIEEQGARVFVDPQVAPMVDAATLHAEARGGRFAFGLAPQQPGV